MRYVLGFIEKRLVDYEVERKFQMFLGSVPYLIFGFGGQVWFFRENLIIPPPICGKFWVLSKKKVGYYEIEP